MFPEGCVVVGVGNDGGMCPGYRLWGAESLLFLANSDTSIGAPLANGGNTAGFNATAGGTQVPPGGEKRIAPGAG